VDGQLLCSLVGVVSEVGFNETELGSLYELRASGRKSKSSLEKKSRKRAKFTKSLNSFQMNGMLKNSRGLRDLAKHLHIADYCRDHNLDFVAISETARQDYSQSLLNRLSGGIDFEWFSRPPRGRSEGILLGVQADTMEILACSDGEYHVKLHIRNKADNFKWGLIDVYGAAQDEFKADFLGELVNLAKDKPYPILIGEGILICLDSGIRKLSNSN
jgi:hypothetical protein